MTKKQKRMKTAIQDLVDYMATYELQERWLDCSDETFIDDVLYGLGVALDKNEHRWANGFDIFKEKLRKHLEIKTIGVENES